MSIRVRHVDGQPDYVLVALCAAEHEAVDGDLYLDDAVHDALYRKFDRDRAQERGTPSCCDRLRSDLESLHKRIRGLAVDLGGVQTDDAVEDARKAAEATQQALATVTAERDAAWNELNEWGYKKEAMAARELLSVEGYSLEPCAANERSLRGWQEAYARLRSANGGDDEAGKGESAHEALGGGE